MGYTHYWRSKGELEQERWDEVVELVHAVCSVAAAQGYSIAGPDGTGKPQFDADKICFNGLAPDHRETFWIDRVPEERPHADDPEWRYFDFCKTGALPYDTVVTACLCVMETVTDGHWRVSSDGDPPDWGPGLALAKKVVSRAQVPPGVGDPEGEDS